MPIKKFGFILFLFLCAACIIQLSSCEKASTTVNTVTPCTAVDVRGNYQGTFSAGSTVNAPFAQILKDNNFTPGAITLTSPMTSFGSYLNTADSIKMSTWNSVNKNYYSFEGVFSNNRTTITGTFKNLTTTSEFGTFTLTRQ